MKEQPASIEALAKFADFQTCGDPQLERMKVEAARFADDVLNDRAPRWLTFLGNAGIGKTMLATRIWQLFKTAKHMEIDWPRSKATEEPGSVRRLIRRRGGFINWGNAVNNRMLKGEYGFLEDLQAYDFFVIDDIIAEYEKHRSLSASKLYHIFDSRLKKWTVITANASLEQIGELLDPRIASRMLRGGSVVVDVDVPDYNLREK